MVGNVIDQLGSAQRVIVVTGYSHVSGFVRRLRRYGYEERPWADRAKEALFQTPVARVYPAGLRGIYEDAVGRAKRGETPFGADPDWVARRAAFATSLPRGP